MAVLTEFQEEEASTYDVFLSFRGKDTRLSFTDHLYQALLNENVSTFLDDEEVEIGKELKPELERAIRNSSASIVVLSENYASSTWCLDELVIILEQSRTSKHIVFPIFYNVETTNIRKQQSSFGDALAKHKERMEAENDQEKKSQGALKLELWAKALTQVADLKGKDANGRRETVFIEEIVKEISSGLDLHLRSELPQLMGRDFSIDEISTWLKEGSSKTGDILTIWGMAGIGKTSLAKYICRLHYHEFERSSFVQDIERRCAQQSSALLDLQKQLLGDIVKGSKLEVRDVDVCTARIEKALSKKRTLVVLDGIDNFHQLDMLVGTKRIHPGNKIIVTTKDRSLTERCAFFNATSPPKHTKHALDGLGYVESLRLLCWHAFRSNGPKEGYEEEATKFVEYCGGHPLALTVLGRSLLGEDVATWVDTFEMVEKKKNYNDIQKVLEIFKISFDSLPSDSYKDMFKHIACFFVGKDREFTETILKECGFGTSSGITKLIDRCFLTAGRENEIMMHQLLQDMGRDLVRQESPKKPWKRSLLWNHEESLNVLKEEKGTEKVQGLALDMKMLETEWVHGSSGVEEHKFRDDSNKYFRAIPSIYGVYDFFSRILWFFVWIFRMFSSSHCKKMEWRTEGLRKMDKLHVLQLDFVKVNGSYKNFSKGLRWLSMHGFLSKYIPSDLPMENLVALDMSHSNLERAWKKPKHLGSLKILNLSYCKLLRAVDLSGLPALEQLILVGCISLIQVCESIGECDRLVFLDLSDCKRLKKLPRSIGKLKKLRFLCIDGCVGIGEFPIEMKDMESLKVLNADGISKNPYAFSSSVVEVVPRIRRSLLCSLPQSLVRLSLVRNNLFNESFPTDMSGLSMLEHLDLGSNPIDSLPNCVRSLNKLRRLDLDECHMLESLLFLPRTIDNLHVHFCNALVKITYYPEISKPPCVYLYGSDSLTEVQEGFKIEAMADMDEEVLSSLGWANLEFVKNREVYHWVLKKWVPIQVRYEYGIFSTWFWGKEVPSWFGDNTRKGSSISFTMPLSPKNQRLQGLNICFVLVHPSKGNFTYYRSSKIRNVIKNQTWTHYGVERVYSEDNEEGVVWLSHWMFGNNELQDGDEVHITMEEGNGWVARECGVSPVYYGDKEDDPLGYYKSWKFRIGQDLSPFQTTLGGYDPQDIQIFPLLSPPLEWE